MYRYIALAAVAFVTACAGQNAGTVDTTDANKSVYTAKSTYAGALIVATAYAKLPRCGTVSAPSVCSDPGVLAQMKQADVTANTAIQSAENAVRTMGSSPTVVQAAVTTALQAVSAFKTITDNYGGK